MEASIILDSISKHYESDIVFEDFSLQVSKGEIVYILGPSGCGKTTLLRTIAGLIQPDQGSVSNEEKAFSFVFQEDRLIPWKTASDNLRIVLKDSFQFEEIEDRILKYLKLVGMSKYAAHFPHQLSGGMRQRISFARALCYPSSTILLDEPFKGLDLRLKDQLLDDMRRLLSDDPRTVVFVTHDPEEAVELGNRIILLSQKPAKIIREINIDKKKLSVDQKAQLINSIKEEIHNT